jgi:hypothetical protein
MRQRIIFTGKWRQHIDGKVLMLQTDSRQLIVRMKPLSGSKPGRGQPEPGA